jgi:hypothetical protein
VTPVNKGAIIANTPKITVNIPSTMSTVESFLTALANGAATASAMLHSFPFHD